MPAKSDPSKSKADPATLISDDAISTRAYYLWEADGRPEGRGDHYWNLAHAEATKAFVDATGNAVAKATKGKSANAAPAAVKATKATKAKVKEAATPKAKVKGEAKPAKKATKPRAAVPKAK
jgi:hypothetical protein